MASLSSASIPSSWHNFIDDSSNSLDEQVLSLRSDSELSVCSNQWQVQDKNLEIKLLNEELEINNTLSRLEKTFADHKNVCREFDWSTPSAASENTPSGTNDRMALTLSDEIECGLAKMETFLRTAKARDDEIDAITTGESWTELSSEEQAFGKDVDSKEINPMAPIYEMVEELNKLMGLTFDLGREFDWSTPSAASENTPSGTNDRMALTLSDEIECGLAKMETFLRTAKARDDEIDAMTTGESWTELLSEEQALGKDDVSKKINPMGPIYEMMEELNKFMGLTFDLGSNSLDEQVLSLRSDSEHSVCSNQWQVLDKNLEIKLLNEELKIYSRLSQLENTFAGLKAFSKDDDSKEMNPMAPIHEIMEEIIGLTSTLGRFADERRMGKLHQRGGVKGMR